MDAKHVRIYLQDHLAAATAGLELVRRARASNEGSAYGEPLARLADEIEADRRALQGMAEDLGFGADKLKNIAAWGLEKVGRLKMNGQVTGYSPLSRLLELEALFNALTGKRALWGSLLVLAPDEPRLDAARLERLRDRADAQRATVEELRDRAAREALLG